MDEAAYQSQKLREVTVLRQDGTEETFKEVRLEVAANGFLRVYRDRSFSGAAPFECGFPHGEWRRYGAFPWRSL